MAQKGRTPYALSMKTLSRKTVFSCPVFEVSRREIEVSSSRKVERFVVEHPGAVVFLPQSEEGDIYLVKQYRAALERSLLELPAGTLERGEDPLECAKRELAEEVKLQAVTWVRLGELFPAPGFCNEKQHLFLARGLSPAQGELDEDEVIEVVKLTPQEVYQAIEDGEICDAKSIAAILRAQLSGFL